MLRAVADELARRRTDLLTVMVHEAGKTIAQADPEICEAIDFARYYAERALDRPRLARRARSTHSGSSPS